MEKKTFKKPSFKPISVSISQSSKEDIISYNIIDQFLNIIQSHNIKMICIDFDNTILKINSSKGFILPSNEHFADFEMFRELVNKASNRNIKVTIVSFGIERIIRDYITLLSLDSKVKVIIYTPSYFGLNEGVSMENDKINVGKSLLVFKALTDYVDGNYENLILPNNVLFIDDNKYNCDQIKSVGVNYSYNVSDPNTGFNLNELKMLCINLFNQRLEEKINDTQIIMLKETPKSEKDMESKYHKYKLKYLDLKSNDI